MATSRYEARLLRRHPLRWARFFALHLVVAGALTAMAVATRNDVFTVVPLPGKFYFLCAAAALVLGSTLAPLSVRLQAVVGAALGGLATVHVLSYLVLMADVTASPGARAVALYLCALWSVVLVTSTAWPKLSATAALDVLEAAFRDDRVC